MIATGESRRSLERQRKMRANDAVRSGCKATAAATVGLATGPSVILVFSFGVFVTPLQSEFGWSRPQIMFGATLIALSIMMLSPLLGWLIDRFGARRVVLASGPTFGAGIGAMALLDGRIATFYLLCGVLPFLAIGLWPIAYLRVVSGWFDTRLGLAIGIANGGIGIGAGLVPLLATSLIAHGGWRACFVGLAALVLCVSLPLNLFMLREPQERYDGKSAASNTASRGMPQAAGFGFAEIVRTRNFKLLVLAFFFLGLVNSLVANQIPMLIDFGVTPQRAAQVASVFGLTVFVGRFIVGIALDRVSAAMLMVVVCAGGLLACVIYASAATGPVVFLGAILLGGVFGAEFDVLSFVVKRYFGMRTFGRTYGVVFAAFQMASALGVMLLPLSRVYTGTYLLGLGFFAAAMAVAAASFLFLGPYLFAPDQPAPDALVVR